MKACKHILGVGTLIACLMLIITSLAPCAEEKSLDQQIADKLKTRFEKAHADWSNKPEATRPAYDAVVRQVFDTLNQDEIRLVAQYLFMNEVQEEAFRRWARFDAAGALKAIRAFEDGNAAKIRLAGTGLEGGPGEVIEGYVFDMYWGALDGWSAVEPLAAWQAFKKREGPLSNSLVIEGYLSEFYRVLLERLAKVDPDLAYNELINYRSDDFEEIHVESMLGGYLRGAPQNRDWRMEANRLLTREWRPGSRVHSEIRTALMGRWLQDDAKAAEEWFRGTDIEGLSWSYRNASKDVKIRNDLGSAAGYWAARDLPAAWDWMKSYKGFERKGFGAAVLHGADVFLSRRASYYNGGAEARAFLSEQAAKLPLAQDRAACVSMIQGAGADHEYLHGEPENPRISEQGGAGQPATRPKSDSESSDKPQSESEGRSR